MQNNKPTLILMVGCPRSGKSTIARKLVYPIVSPDEIRIVMHGTPFRAEAEPLVWATAHIMVESLFGAGHNHVILDACNVSRRRRNEWQSAKWNCKFLCVRTDLEECKRRALANGQEYLIKVIDRMAKELEWPTTDLYQP